MNSKYKTINKDFLKEFRDDFMRLNEAIELKYGVKVQLGNISYTESDFNTTLKVYKDNGGECIEKLEFNKLCKRYGIAEDDFGIEFSYNGKKFKLIGFKPKNRTYPIIAMESSSNKRFKLPLESLNSIKNII